MLKSSLLGVLAKLYASIATLTDNKTYAFKNGQLVEVASGGGLITKANFIAWAKANAVAQPNIHIPEVGDAAWLFEAIYGVAGPYPAYRELGFTINSGGTGAGVLLPITFGSLADSGYGLTTGSTATGTCTLTQQGYHSPKVSDNTIRPVSEYAEFYFFAKLKVPVALSSAAERYKLLWQASPLGISSATLEYSDTINAGKWQLKYRNAANVEVIVDTGKTVNAGSNYEVGFSIVWDAGLSKFTGVLTINGTVFNITDMRLTAMPAVSTPSLKQIYQITKSIGTTPAIAKIPLANAIAVLK